MRRSGTRRFAEWLCRRRCRLRGHGPWRGAFRDICDTCGRFVAGGAKGLG